MGYCKLHVITAVILVMVRVIISVIHVEINRTILNLIDIEIITIVSQMMAIMIQETHSLINVIIPVKHVLIEEDSSVNYV